MPEIDNDAAKAQAEANLGRVIAGKYELNEVLGAGGAGEVYRAVQLGLSRDVAVKLLRTDLREKLRKEFEARFMREAARAGQLSHPNVVTVHDFGLDEDGTLYAVMEYIDGDNLEDVLLSGKLDLGEAVHIAIGVLKGLRHAHSRDLIHRDIKPANILLVRDDEGRRSPKIVDFGLVKADGEEEAHVTQAGMIMGTPAYMSPEQGVSSTDVTTASDIYSFGCVLYEMITGRVPFHAETALKIVAQHMNAPYRPMRELGLDVDPELERVVRVCMAKEATARPTAAEGIELLRALGRPQPTQPVATGMVDFGPMVSAQHTMDSADFDRVSIGAPPPPGPARQSTPPPGLEPMTDQGALLTKERTVTRIDLAEAPPSRSGIVALLGWPVIVVALFSALAGAALLVVAMLGVGPASFTLAGTDETDTGGAGIEVTEPDGAETPTTARPTKKKKRPVSTTAPSGSQQTGSTSEEAQTTAPVETTAERPTSTGGSPLAHPKGIVMQRVEFGPQHAQRCLAFVNRANSDDLIASGVTAKVAERILAQRPFRSLKDVSYLQGMNTKQARALFERTK